MTHCEPCPICNGRGRVPLGFYNSQNGQFSSSATATEQCRTCHGTGIVWAPDELSAIEQVIETGKKGESK